MGADRLAPLAFLPPEVDGEGSLVLALRSPACYPRGVQAVTVIETHISWVFLAGEYAYKVKKPVRLPFLDSSSLASRRQFCHEEVRLNRRTAPGIYLDVARVVAGPRGMRIDGADTGGFDAAPVEYAVRMRRFAQEDVLDSMAARGALRPEHLVALAGNLAVFHAGAARAPAGSQYGSPALVRDQALANFDALRARVQARESGRLDELEDWTRGEWLRINATLAARHEGGFVRECHGDLHLANIVLCDGSPRPFDCIEFDPALRVIDVMSDVAFVVMDLERRGLSLAATRFLDRYLQATGDYEGLAVLRFFMVYRALVRAKVEALRDGAAAQEGGRAWLDTARRLTRPPRPILVLMHGLSGSGKSTVAAEIVKAFPALRVRSDVERKRRHGLAPQARSGSAPGSGLYAPAETLATYACLEAFAADALEAGLSVVVDATFLQRAERDLMRRLASRKEVPVRIIACRAPEAELRRRLALRVHDPSEADAGVLEFQQRKLQPLAPDEAADVTPIDTASGTAPPGGWDALLRRL